MLLHYGSPRTRTRPPGTPRMNHVPTFACLQCRATATASHLQNVFIFPNRNSVPVQLTSSPSVLPLPVTPNISGYFPFLDLRILGIPYPRDRTVFVLLCLASSTQHHVLKVHHGTTWLSSSCHCMAGPHFLSPFLRRRGTRTLFPLFGWKERNTAFITVQLNTSAFSNPQGRGWLAVNDEHKDECLFYPRRELPRGEGA